MKTIFLIFSAFCFYIFSQSEEFNTSAFGAGIYFLIATIAIKFAENCTKGDDE